MQRYFVESKNEMMIQMAKDDIHHMKKVMRQRNGDQVICIVDSINYLCEIVDIDNGIVKIMEEVQNNTELDFPITLVYSMPKGDKFDFVLQKATELGVSRIVPMLSKRTVVKLDKASFAKKRVRYEKILKEAAEQSYRNQIPLLMDYITLDELEPYLSDHNLVAYEEDAKQGELCQLKNTLKKVREHEGITVIVGCEGGFEASEIEKMKSMGVVSCSLGKRILRSETAPLYLLSAISYELELK